MTQTGVLLSQEVLLCLGVLLSQEVLLCLGVSSAGASGASVASFEGTSFIL